MVVLGEKVVSYERGAPVPPLKDLDSDGEAAPDGCLVQESGSGERERHLLLLLFTLVTGPGRSVSLKLSDTRVHEPQIRARPVTTAHF